MAERGVDGMGWKRKILPLLIFGVGLVLFEQYPLWAAPTLPDIPLPSLQVGLMQAEGPRDVVLSLQILAMLTILTVAPAILLMLTGFTRIVIVLGFVRNALALQQTPPNQVVVALALFLTFFVMTPVWSQIYDDALGPYLSEQIGAAEAWEKTVEPVRAFMLRHTRDKELSLMVTMSGMERPQNASEVPTRVLIPAFVLSEIKTAFQMGIVIYVPFIVVDMIVASVLMAMGMIMLPPMMISLPFKVLLFVMADGWNLVISSLMGSFS
jgi:flagellar biosynthetic protein FliP